MIRNADAGEGIVGVFDYSVGIEKSDDVKIIGLTETTASKTIYQKIDPTNVTARFITKADEGRYSSVGKTIGKIDTVTLSKEADGKLKAKIDLETAVEAGKTTGQLSSAAFDNSDLTGVTIAGIQAHAGLGIVDADVVASGKLTGEITASMTPSTSLKELSVKIFGDEDTQKSIFDVSDPMKLSLTGTLDARLFVNGLPTAVFKGGMPER